MWPTNQTALALALGLVPLLAVGRLVWVNGAEELLRFRSLGVVVTWIGFQLVPWIAYLSGAYYHDFLLVSGYVDKGLYFSALSMIVFMVGASLRPLPRWATFADLRGRLSKPIPLEWFVIALFLSAGTLLVEIGGPGELFHADYSRGFGQFTERVTWTAKATQMNNVAKPLVDLFLAVCSANLLYTRRSGVFRGLLAGAGIAVAMAAGVHGFSRAAGWPLLVLAAYALAVRSPRRWATGAAACAFMVALGWVGYHGRGQANPGLGNFVHVTSNFRELEQQATAQPNSSTDYSFDAMPPWTRKAALADEESPGAFNVIAALLEQLNPVPSELFHPSGMGIDLTVAMRTVGSSGITTPALGEVYWFGGFTALWMSFVFGIICNQLEQFAVRTPALLGWLMRCACYLSFAIGLHQGVRATTRPFVYCFIVYFLWKFFGRGSQSASTRRALRGGIRAAGRELVQQNGNSG